MGLDQLRRAQPRQPRGLGEVRPAVRTPLRVREAARLGFEKVMISAFESDEMPPGVALLRVRNLKEALKVMR